jgi:ABC-type transport system substrate-binding protein
MSRTRFGAMLAAGIVAVAACGPAASPSAPPASQPPASSAPGTSTAPSTAPSATPAAGQPKEGGTLVVAIPGDINRTDPSLVDDANSTYVEQQVVETLVTLKPGTGGDIVPGLAESWTISPDGLTYTFKIRQGVKTAPRSTRPPSSSTSTAGSTSRRRTATSGTRTTSTP